jgi:hypothetical protein
MVVASETPTVAWQITVDAGAVHSVGFNNGAMW